MRLSVIATAICLSIVGISTAQDAEAAIRRPTHIGAQGLAPALQMLAKERNVQVVYRSELVRDQRTSGAAGDLTFDEALTQLLSGTGLTYRYLDDKAITIVPVGSSTGSATTSSLTSEQSGTADSTSSHARAGREGGGDSPSEPSNKSFWDRFRLAQADQGAPASSHSVEKKNEQAADKKPVQLEEVIVTAQKREERLQDVPVPVTAVSAGNLVNNNLFRVQDYYNQIPGFNFMPGDRGQLFVSIRGLVSGRYTTSTVGYVVDDVPFAPSAVWTSAPEIDPSDLSAIEVLRGPQGTLYGADSLGGLIKYTTADPTTDRLSGRVQTGLTEVKNGDQPGYSVRASVNVPLSDTWAVRASGFSRRDPGYVDNPVIGDKGINEANAYGGRVSALWRPSQNVSLKLGAMLQEWKSDGSPDVFLKPGFGDLQQNYYIGAGAAVNKARVLSAILKARLGAVDLTSVSGYSWQEWGGALDEHGIASFVQANFSGSGVLYIDNHVGEKYSQEIRLAAPLSQRIDGLLGVFYTHENYRNTFDIPAIDPATGATVGYWTRGADDGTSVYDDYAAFADLTFRLTDRMNVQVGGRASHIRQGSKESIYRSYFASTFFGVDPFIQTFPAVTNKPVTYLVTPQFKVSPDLMIYARMASGFRPGGANTFVAAVNGAPPTYAPDKTHNYELGVKGNTPNHALSFDASIYRIDWKDVQLAVYPPNNIGTINGNGGRAKSQGVELSAELRPLRGLMISGWIDYDDASLTDALPPGPAYGLPGDRLPFSARYTGNFLVNQEFPVSGNVTALVGAMLIYVGDRKDEFTGPPPAERLDLPAYTQVDLRARLQFGSWEANLTLNNVADKRGVLTNSRDVPNVFNYIQPRTVGLSITKTFD